MTRHGLASTMHWLALLALLVSPALANAADREFLPRTVVAAFREVTAEPAKSTAQIYADGYRAALGAVVDKDGYVVTKSSELKGKVEVQLPGSKRYEATIVGRDPALDLAVLKINATELPVIAWSETTPPVGSWLVTPGIENNPVAIGVVSVSPRKIPAPSGALGISLAKVDRPAQIEEILPNTAADRAGLEVGDVILKVNDTKIEGVQHLIETIKSFQPGDKVDLKIRRDGSDKTITVTLGSRSQLDSGERSEFQNNLGGQLSERRAGFGLVLQHDSVLKPSECGGPIVDLDGKAVGLNIARAGRVESYALTGPVVQEAVKKLLETHHTSASSTER